MSSLYPLPAADGASIVVCGHSSGLSILKVYANNSADQRSDVSDSTLVSESSPGSIRNPWVASPWLDVKLNSPVQCLAFPPLSLSSRKPDYLRSHLVIAVGCANSSLSVVSFGLDERRDGANINITKVDTASHQDLISSVAITWTSNLVEGETRESRSGDRTQADEPQYSLLLASISTTGSGLIVVHRLSLSGHIQSRKNASKLIARQFLRVPLLASTISFSPSAYPSTRHSLLLVSSHATGIVKIFNTIRTASTKKRKLADPAHDSEDVIALSALENCLTLYAGFTPNGTLPHRKQIFDARWCAQGKSIIALLEGGEWVVWDLENPDNLSATTTLRSRKDFNKSSTSSTINPAKFALRGTLSSIVPKTKGNKPISTTTSGPTTPHTRKARSANLFGSSGRISDSDEQGSSSVTGHISIHSHQPPALANDDAIILTFGSVNEFIPSLQSQHRSEISASVETIKGRKPTTQVLPQVQISGESQLSIHILPSASLGGTAGQLAVLNYTPTLLVITDSRLIIRTAADSRNFSNSQSLVLPLRRAAGQEASLLSRREDRNMLDLDAMDKMLQSMENSSTHQDLSSLEGPEPTSTKLSSASSVTRALESTSPTIAKPNKSKLVVSKGGRPLFS